VSDDHHDLPVPEDTSLALASWLVSALGEQGQTVAMAESLTGGLLTAALVEVPGASAVLRGGVVAYATRLKAQVLGVDQNLLDEHGAVHAEVAIQMAQGVREVLGADWGVSTTGVAGPGAQDGIPAGTVFIGIAGPAMQDDAGEGSGQYVEAHELDLDGDRDSVRNESVHGALKHLVFAVGRATGAGRSEQATPVHR